MSAATDDAAPRRPPWLAPPFGDLTSVWLRTLLVLLLGAVVALRLPGFFTERTFLWTQDLPVLALFVALTVGVGLLLRGRGLAGLAALLDAPAAAWVCGLAAMTLVAGWLGAGLVFEHYTLSLDEFLANFDAKIFASGQLMAPIPLAWRHFAFAMQPIYILPTPGHADWVSSYLPINAAARALASRVGLEDLLNPALSAFSVVATWAVGRRLWPGQPKIALIAAILLGSSAQLIVTGMSAYAMPMHLALNLAWLWLFLRRDWIGYAGALVVGFFAVGIHQVLFHALFAAPFILQLWLDRRWRLAALYTLAYAAIGGFWIGWFTLEAHLMGLASTAAAGGITAWAAARIADVFGNISVFNVGPMALSLIRFVTWQHPLTAPLALAGALAAERAKGHVRALAFGVVLTLVAMTFLEPTQTHGWGYRYMHGLLGSTALLAAWSWERLTASLSAEARTAASAGFVLTSLVALAICLPLRTFEAWSYAHPYAVADRQIQSSPADVVVIDDTGAHAFNAGTIDRNDPFLAHGPKVMALMALTGDDVRDLCQHHSVALFDGEMAAADGVDTVAVAPNRRSVALRAEMTALGCGAPVVK